MVVITNVVFYFVVVNGDDNYNCGSGGVKRHLVDSRCFPLVLIQ